LRAVLLGPKARVPAAESSGLPSAQFRTRDSTPVRRGPFAKDSREGRPAAGRP
jgi:hypothetical protein